MIIATRRLMSFALALLSLGLVVAAARPGAGQAARIKVTAEYAQATAAMARKEFAAAVQHFTRALSGAPTHPGLMAELARARFLAGDRRAAIDGLLRALRLGGGLDVADDPIMSPLLAAADAASVREAAAALRAPVSTSQEAFRITERDLIPEGIAFDPVDKAFYVGSIYRRKIVRVDAAGRMTAFADGGRDRLLSVLGMKVDAARRILWAATEGNLQMDGASPQDDGRAALVRCDLASGRVIEKYEAPRDGSRHLFNDIALGRQGEVFVTDSEAGSVYRVAGDGRRLERLVGPDVLEYANGIALSSDERRLFVAHVAGIAVVDLATGRVAALPHGDGVTLADIDGLYRDGHRLVAVQNGLTPARVVEFSMTDAEDRVTGLKILERGHPLFASIPTTGAVANGWFYYIANAQLRAFGADHHILPTEQLQETVILKTRLAR